MSVKLLTIYLIIVSEQKTTQNVDYYTTLFHIYFFFTLWSWSFLISDDGDIILTG